MNSTANVLPFLPNANPVWPGTTSTAAPQQPTPAHQELTTTESSASHICHARAEKFGTIPSVNVFALKELSLTQLLVSDVPLVNFTLIKVATAQTEPSSMEPNVP